MRMAVQDRRYVHAADRFIVDCRTDVDRLYREDQSRTLRFDERNFRSPYFRCRSVGAACRRMGGDGARRR